MGYAGIQGVEHGRDGRVRRSKEDAHHANLSHANLVAPKLRLLHSRAWLPRQLPPRRPQPPTCSARPGQSSPPCSGPCASPEGPKIPALFTNTSTAWCFFRQSSAQRVTAEPSARSSVWHSQPPAPSALQDSAVWGREGRPARAEGCWRVGRSCAFCGEGARGSRGGVAGLEPAPLRQEPSKVDQPCARPAIGTTMPHPKPLPHLLQLVPRSRLRAEHQVRALPGECAGQLPANALGRAGEDHLLALQQPGGGHDCDRVAEESPISQRRKIGTTSNSKGPAPAAPRRPSAPAQTIHTLLLCEGLRGCVIGAGTTHGPSHLFSGGLAAS